MRTTTIFTYHPYCLSEDFSLLENLNTNHTNNDIDHFVFTWYRDCVKLKLQ